MTDRETPSATSVRLDAARNAIAAEVRAEMARQNRTLRDLGDVLGMHHTSLHMRAKGEVSFRADELVLLAEALGVPVERFLRIPSAAATVAGAA